MKYLLCLSALLACLFHTPALHAQGENNQWCFGQKLGLNFNTTPPSFFMTNMGSAEGSAAVSDLAGNLLFYSSGGNNWDRNGNLMPNGSGLMGNGPVSSVSGNVGSSMTGVAIVKSPANNNQYYIITTDAIEDNIYKAYYSVIDMSLNGGLGDVIPSQKNIVLANDVAEGVITTRTGGCSGYWVLMHRKNGNQYLAFKIGQTGITTTPVVSAGQLGSNTPSAPSNGRIRFNHSGNRLVRGGGYFELATFNNITGVLSDFFVTQVNLQVGGAQCFTFSPDDSKLYAGSIYGLTQYNIALLPDTAAFENAQVVLNTNGILDMRPGPDGKIYCHPHSQVTMHVINMPNAAGAACQFTQNAFNVPVYTNGDPFFSELGNPVVIQPPADTVVHPLRDTTVCFGQELTLHPPMTYQSYYWNSGAITPEHTVQADGRYWLFGYDECHLYIDSFRVKFIDFSTDIGTDTSICAGQQLVLDASASTAGATYLWQDNSPEPVITVSNEGTYRVKVTVGPCSLTDSIHVGILDPFMNIAEPDTLICKGAVLTLHALAFPQSTYVWNTGNTGDAIHTDSAGTYRVTATNVCGVFYDTVVVTTEDCRCNVFVPNAFSPNGDGKNDVLEARLYCLGAADFYMAVYNRYGQRLFESHDPSSGWNGRQNGNLADAGAYFYYITYKNKAGEKIKKKGDVVLIR